MPAFLFASTYFSDTARQYILKVAGGPTNRDVCVCVCMNEWMLAAGPIDHPGSQQLPPPQVTLIIMGDRVFYSSKYTYWKIQHYRWMSQACNLFPQLFTYRGVRLKLRSKPAQIWGWCQCNTYDPKFMDITLMSVGGLSTCFWVLLKSVESRNTDGAHFRQTPYSSLHLRTVL